MPLKLRTFAVGAAVLALSMMTTAPAFAVETPVLDVSIASSASYAAAGDTVVFTVTATNAGEAALDLSGYDEYSGPGASVGLWLPDVAGCSVEVGGGTVGGSTDTCFERVPTDDQCNTASRGFPPGWSWTGAFTSTRPASLAPGESITCTVGVRILQPLVAGSGLALEAWSSPNGFEHWPGQHHDDASFTVLTVAAADGVDPAITGTPEVGNELALVPGFTGPWDEDLQYQWLRDGVLIDGATGLNYVVTTADIGARIGAQIIGQNSKGLSPTSATFTVDPVGPVPTPTPTPTPTTTPTPTPTTTPTPIPTPTSTGSDSAATLAETGGPSIGSVLAIGAGALAVGGVILVRRRWLTRP